MVPRTLLLLSLSASCTGNIESGPDVLSGSMGGRMNAATGGQSGASARPAQTGGTTHEACKTGTPARLRRLTNDEYARSVAALLPDANVNTTLFLPDANVWGFKNNAEALRVDETQTQAYQASALQLARSHVKDPHQFMGCAAGSTELACAQSFIARFGKRTFRRPLTPDEQERYARLFADNNPRIGTVAATQLLVATFLQSANFIYRTELGSLVTGASTSMTAHETASALSYAFWGGPPDDELTRLADEGTLQDDDVRVRQVQRLLGDPRANTFIDQLFDGWLRYQEIPAVKRDPKRTPKFKDQLPRSMHASARLTARHVFRTRSLSDLFTSPEVIIDGPMAEFYGDGARSGDAPARVGSRVGLLTQPGLMAVLAHEEESSPIFRGKFVLENVLCSAVPPPPPDAPSVESAVDPTATTRERFAAHSGNPACVGCHRFLDPLGFAFEAYDSLGVHRTNEAGRPIDTSVELRIGSDLDGKYPDGPAFFANWAGSAQVRACFANQVMRLVLARKEHAEDACEREAYLRELSTQDDAVQAMAAVIASRRSFVERSVPTN